MSKTCIDLHTPYLKSKFNKLIKSGVKEKDAELEIAIEEAKRIFNSLNSLKTKLGLKLSEEDEITNAIVTAKAEDFQDLSETFDLEGELKTKIAALEKIIKDAESEDAPATVKQKLIEKGNAKLAEMKAELAAMQQSKNETSSTDDKKADIERRRQELISKYNVEFKEIARKQYDKVSKKYIDGISTQIWSNGKLIAEYETRVEAENELNKKLDALINNTIDSKISLGDNIFINGITVDGNTFSVLNTSERMITIVDIGGVKVPFYLTTGLGGKNLTPAWYPMFGYSPSGWLNKTDGKDMESFYSRIIGKEASDVLRKVSEKLNNKLGVTPNSIIESGIISKQQTQDAVNAVLNFTPAENQKIDASVDYKVELAKLENNIKSIGEEINAKYDAKLAALTKQVTSETEVSGKEQLDALFGEVVTPQPTNKQEIPIEKLRRLAKEKIEESKLQSTSEFNYRGGTYTIDYNRNLLSPIPKTATAQKNLIDSIGKQDIYDVINSTINSKDVYLVFNKNLNKFVILDKNLNSIPLDESVVTSKTYQDAQNRCK